MEVMAERIAQARARQEALERALAATLAARSDAVRHERALVEDNARLQRCLMELLGSHAALPEMAPPAQDAAPRPGRKRNRRRGNAAAPM